MAEVYCYIPHNSIEDAVDCGLKLSEWQSGEVIIYGKPRKYISALLNPKDDIKMYKNDNYTCLRVDVENRYCFIGDKYLRIISSSRPEFLDMYTGSIMPVENYVFGMYRLPECLVVSTIIGDSIHVLDRRKDSPVLFDRSEELYTNNMIEAYRQRHEDFNDVLLYCYYEVLAQKGGVERIEDDELGITVFIGRDSGKPVVLRRPLDEIRELP